jgi:hypothetical protein
VPIEKKIHGIPQIGEPQLSDQGSCSMKLVKNLIKDYAMKAYGEVVV